MMRRGKRLRAAGHIIYRGSRSLSAPLRPSAPGGHALRRRPSARRPPFGAKSAPRPCTLRPRPMRKARGFSLFPSTFPRKTHLSKKRSCVLLAPFADGLAPTAGAQGKNFTSPRRKCAEMRMRSLFFLFLLAFYAGKTRYICIENLFYQLRMAKSRRFVAPFVCPAECSPTFHPSL